MSINPCDSLIWGNLYSSDEIKEIFSDRSQLQLMCEFEAALARAEARIGLVPAAIAETITKVANVDNLDLRRIAQSTEKVGYPVVGLIQELARIAGEEAARYLHLGATTQDVLDTTLSLQIKKCLGILRSGIIDLTRAFGRLIRRFRETPLAGRTHLKHAVPISFGFKCAVWAAPFISHVERLDSVAKRACVLQFGGAAGTLAPLGSHGFAVMEALAEELNLGIPLAPWHVARDSLAEVACTAGLISGSLGKFALDVALMTQTEVGELAEPYEAGRGASSTMPQKRNPLSSEYILAATRAVPHLVSLMLSGMVQEHERAAGAWQSEALALPQCLALTAGALKHALTLAEGLHVDAVRMRMNLDMDFGLIMAESLATALIPVLGRTEAHHMVSELCRQAIETKQSLKELAFQNQVLRRHLSESQIAQALDPSRYLGSAPLFASRVADRIDALV